MVKRFPSIPGTAIPFGPEQDPPIRPPRPGRLRDLDGAAVPRRLAAKKADNRWSCSSSCDGPGSPGQPSPPLCRGKSSSLLSPVCRFFLLFRRPNRFRRNSSPATLVRYRLLGAQCRGMGRTGSRGFRKNRTYSHLRLQRRGTLELPSRQSDPGNLAESDSGPGTFMERLGSSGPTSPAATRSTHAGSVAASVRPMFPVRSSTT